MNICNGLLTIFARKFYRGSFFDPFVTITSFIALIKIFQTCGSVFTAQMFIHMTHRRHTNTNETVLHCVVIILIVINGVAESGCRCRCHCRCKCSFRPHYKVFICLIWLLLEMRMALNQVWKIGLIFDVRNFDHGVFSKSFSLNESRLIIRSLFDTHFWLYARSVTWFFLNIRLYFTGMMKIKCAWNQI